MRSSSFARNCLSCNNYSTNRRLVLGTGERIWRELEEERQRRNNTLVRNSSPTGESLSLEFPKVKNAPVCDPRLRDYRKRLSLESEVTFLRSQVDSLNKKLGLERRWIDTAEHDHRKQLAEATDLQCRSGYILLHIHRYTWCEGLSLYLQDCRIGANG